MLDSGSNHSSRLKKRNDKESRIHKVYEYFMFNHRLAKYQAPFPQDKTIRHVCIRTSTPSRKS